MSEKISLDSSVLEKEIFRPVCLLRGGVLSVRNRMFLNIF